jgi:hypothetical protein
MARQRTSSILRLSTHAKICATLLALALFHAGPVLAGRGEAAIPVYPDAIAMVGRWASMGLPSIGCVDATPAVNMPATRFTFIQAAGVIEGGTAQGFWVCDGTIIYEFNAAAVWATWYGWAKPNPGNSTDIVCTFRFCANSSPMSISVEVDAFTAVGVMAP